jgi:hypothetical protein
MGLAKTAEMQVSSLPSRSLSFPLTSILHFTQGNPTNVWELCKPLFALRVVIIIEISTDTLAKSSSANNPSRERCLLYVPGVGSESRSMANLLVQIYGTTVGKLTLQ